MEREAIVDRSGPKNQFQIERRISTAKKQLAMGVIDRAIYRGEVDLLRSSLKQILKGGGQT